MSPRRKSLMVILPITAAFIVGVSGFLWQVRSQPPSRQLVEGSSPSGLPRSPLNLSSAKLSHDGKEILLEFGPDLKPFDAADLTLEFHFKEETPSGLAEAKFIPTIDWSTWNIPVLGKKPRKLRLGSIGSFHQMSVEISYKSTLIDSRSYTLK